MGNEWNGNVKTTGGRDCAAIGVPQAQEAAISTFPIWRHEPFVDRGNCSLL